MKNPSLRNVYTFFFLLGLFFIPFNSFEGISFLGEYSRESATLFFLAALIFLSIEVVIKKRLYFPLQNGVFASVLIFLSWCILATLFNLESVNENYFKGIGGVARFIRQFISITLVAFFFYYLYIQTLKNMDAKNILRIIRRVFLISLIIVTIYSTLETLIIVFGMSSLRPVIMLFNYLPFTQVILTGDRISGLSYETPALAIYLISICGWMLSYIITSNSLWRFLPALIVLELTFFSGSRTGLVVISLQYLVFFGVLAFYKKYRKNILYLFSGMTLLVSVALVLAGGKIIEEAQVKLNSLNFQKNLLTSISNRSRFGMQYASFQVFKDNPLTGVGFGQMAYAGFQYYPAWAITDNYEFRLNYKNQQRSSFPPTFNIYLRIMAETGIIGLLLFLSIFLIAFWRSYKLLLLPEGPERVLGLVAFVSIIGFAVNWFQIDTFRIFGFWLCLALLSIRYPQISSIN